MKRVIESILIVSFTCFGIASAVTTFLGVMSVLESYDEYLKYGLSILIALATSGVMLYIGFSIPKFKKDGKLVLVILAYFVIASMSIFFNFVTFYQGQIISRTVGEDVRALNSELTTSFGNAMSTLDEEFNISFLKDSVAYYNAAAKSEAEHAMRPGKNWRYQKLKEKLNLFESQLENAEQSYADRAKEIKGKYEVGKKAVSDVEKQERVEDKINSAEVAIKSIDEMNAITKGINSEYKFEPFNPEFLKVKKPDYILQLIVDIISNYDKIEGQAKTRFGISMFLSILLDIPIFITLLLLGSDMSLSGGSKPKNIWN
jgi:hypothetical protein